VSGYELKKARTSSNFHYYVFHHNPLSRNEESDHDTYNALFHSMLEFIPLQVLLTLEKGHGTGRKTRPFSRWNHFDHLIFMQLRPQKNNFTLLDHSNYLPAFVSNTDYL